MRASRLDRDRPIMTKSSAKHKQEMLRGPRSIPSPEELSSFPMLLINIEKRRGLRLHPKNLGFISVECCNGYLVSPPVIRKAVQCNDH